MVQSTTFKKIAPLENTEEEKNYIFDETFFNTSYSPMHSEDPFAEEEDLFTHTDLSGKVNIDSDDLIFMDLSDIAHNDSVYGLEFDEDEDVDVLLGSKEALHSVTDMFEQSQEAFMEMAVLGDNIQGQSMQEMLHGVGITKNTDGSISLGQGWQANRHENNFSEYTHSESDTTLLVHQTLVVTGS